MRWQTQDGFDAQAIGNFLGGTGSAFEPGVEVLNFHGVLDGDIDYGNLNGIYPLSDAHDPIIAADGREAKGDRFIKGFGGYFNRVFDAIHVLDGDAARTDRHDEKEFTIFAFYSL
jgi:hypothetical protein